MPNQSYCLRYFLASLLLLLGISSLPAQNKSANNWVFGYDHDYDDDPLFGGSLITFNSGVADTVRFHGILHMDSSNSSISDPNTGELLFYTNGLHVANAEHEFMLNGEYIDDPANCCGGDYQIATQGTLILPDPGDSLRYYIFQGGRKFIASNPHDTLIGLGGWNRYYSIVDMRGDGGLGEVVATQQMLIVDTLEYSKLSATRHANGRDWWILFPEYRSNKVYRVLLSPEGPQVVEPQELSTWLGEGAGTAVFSPDGSKYLRASNYVFGTEYLHLYDFDRCTGLLSNVQTDTVRDLNYAALGFGAAFSPGGRFVYLSFYQEIFQYDTWADDFFGSRQRVALWDGSADTLINTDTSFFDIGIVFNTPSLAPDGKIYINSIGSVRYLTVIEHPDSLGMACNVVQRALKLPTLNFASIPVFPHYELGALPDSPCDTLGLVDATTALRPELGVKAYPNPTSGPFRLSWEVDVGRPLSVQLLDLHGRVLEQHSVAAYRQRIDLLLSDYPPGVYVYQLRDAAGVLARGRIVRQ